MAGKKVAANEQIQSFNERLQRIDKTTRVSRRAKGPKRTGVMDNNEMMRQEARKARLSWGMVFKTAVLIWVLFLGLRTFMAYDMGPVGYENRVSELREGSTIERMISYTLERGPVMAAIDRALVSVQKMQTTAPSNTEIVITDGTEEEISPSETQTAPTSENGAPSEN